MEQKCYKVNKNVTKGTKNVKITFQTTERFSRDELLSFVAHYGIFLRVWPCVALRGIFCSIAQWSEGVTKPIKKYSQIDTVWDFLITFGCKMKE